MAATIQKVEKPLKYRVRDTSSSHNPVGPELFVTADAASIVNEANGYAAWTVADSDTTLSVESSTVHAGSYATKYVATDNGGGIYIDMNTYCTVGKTYKVSIYGRHTGTGTTNNKHYIRFSSATGMSTDINNLYGPDARSNFDKEDSSSAWELRTDTFVYDGDKYRYFGAKESGAENDGGMLLDSLSIKEVEPSPNNNHGLLFSGRALEFDGVADYIEANQESTGLDWESVINGGDNVTLACWIYIHDVSYQTGGNDWKTIFGPEFGYQHGVWFTVKVSGEPYAPSHSIFSPVCNVIVRL